MPIWLNVNPRSGVPLYLQLVDQIKHAMQVGTLQTGDELPTVRQLVSELTIAPNTVVKAYKELQDMGLIESRAGRGTVVTGQLNGAARQQQQATLLERLHDVVRDASNLELSETELEAHFRANLKKFYAQPGRVEPSRKE